MLMTFENMKKWIDNADYETLFKRWIFGPSADPFFQGDIGDYYSETMAKKRIKINKVKK